VARIADWDQEQQDRQAKNDSECPDDAQLSAVIPLSDFGGKIDWAIAQTKEVVP
jgi:hypothetical protein